MSIYSLKNQKEFDLVNKCGVKLNSHYFIIIYAQNFFPIKTPTDNPIFLGMKVGRKFSKKAVVRNKAKRITRHLVRDLLNNGLLKGGDKAFIIIPKRHVLSAKFAQLLSNLQNILRKQSSS